MRAACLGWLWLFAGCSAELPLDRLGPYQLATGETASLRAGYDGTLSFRVFGTGERRVFEPSNGVWKAVDTISDGRLAGAALAFTNDGLLLKTTAGELDAHQVELETVEAQVTSHDGTALHVRLIYPAGAGPHPAVVLAHGSGDAPATLHYSTADLFPLYGVAVAVFDKRGTGRSEGVYDMDFFELADDVGAVADWVTQQARIDAERVGVSGYSQGGWIGPLAAARHDTLAFVVANYGMIDSPRSEARLETLADLRAKGVGGESLVHAADVLDAAIDIVASDFDDHWDEFERLREAYAGEAWLEQVSGTLDDFLTWPRFAIQLVGPMMSHSGLPWDYSSEAALDRLTSRRTPVAYLLAEHDSSAPPAYSLKEIARRQERGDPIHLQVFAGTDHGFLFFEQDGLRRKYGDYHPDAYVSELNWVRRFAGLPELETL